MTESEAPLSDVVLTAVDEIFRTRVAAGIAPSSVWGIFDAHGIVASAGHGDRGDGNAPDQHTVYRIASCTKSVTAAALMTLVEQGAVALDTPISTLVPAFAAVTLPGSAPAAPTLRMLLTMSAGFPTDDPWADRQEPISDDALDTILRNGLLFDSSPGTRFAYSNLGYALIGRAVQELAGIPFRAHVERTILRPLDLDSTAFTAETASGYVVTGHRHGPDGWEPLPLSGPGAFSPIGGLFSTVSDLSRWARHLAAAFGGESETVAPLSKAGRRTMQQAARLIPRRLTPTSRPTGYGFGLFVEEDDEHGPIISHSGGYPGFSAHMRWSVRSGLGVIAFENATQARVASAAIEAHDLVLGAQTAPTSPAVLSETRRAAVLVQRLMEDWDDALADIVFSPNVAIDEPYERRRLALREAKRDAGVRANTKPTALTSVAPTHLSWRLEGTHADLVVEIRMAPPKPALVQTVRFRTEQHLPHPDTR